MDRTTRHGSHAATLAARQMREGVKRTGEIGSRAADTVMRQLADLLGIEDDQIASIEQACELDRKILRGELTEKRIKQLAEGIAANASAVGVPIAAVYLSGSATGLSAAGIASGLAALGLGGVLGLSAMISGLGIAVVGGAVVYRGARWFMGRSGRAKSVRRQKMLQDVIQNHQRALANLAEDIGILGERPVGLTADVEGNQQRLTKLAKEITLFRGAVGELRARERKLEEELQREREKPPAEGSDEDETESSFEVPALPAKRNNDGSDD